MIKRSTLKKIVLSFAILLLVVIGSVWIFYHFYFQDYVNDFLKPKLRDAILTTTHGHYRLDIGKVVYTEGALYCVDFELHRIRYGDHETGITLESLKQDTVTLSGWNLYDLVMGNGSFIKRLEMHSPTIVVTEVDEGREKISHREPDTLPVPKSLPQRLPVISFDSIILTDMRIEVPKQFQPQGSLKYYEHSSARLAGFRLDSISVVTQPLMYSGYVGFDMPAISFHTSDSAYEIGGGPIHADLSDSTIHIDSFYYKPNYSEDDFSGLQPFLRGRLDFHCKDITVHGFNLEKMLRGECLTFHSCKIDTCSFDYYSDKRKPREKNPEPPMMPQEFIQKFPMHVNIDSLLLANGTITIRERGTDSKQPGTLHFDRVRIAATPYCTDSLCRNNGKATHISISCMFLGDAPVNVSANYELQHKELDLTVDANVGTFPAKQVNSFLVPNERKEVTSGTVEGGKLHLDIRDGTAIMTATPLYKELSIRILPKSADEKRGFIEGIKTFVANTFVLHSENIEKDGKPAQSATITLRREKDQEFLQFIWIALRKTLGKIIGGFD
jgi:hypothetical protein